TDLLATGEDAAAEALLSEMRSDRSWARERVLERLTNHPGAMALLPHFATALEDDADPQRRNAARSALAALAAPGTEVCEEALAKLDSLLKSGDPDVRLLAATALGEAGNVRARSALESAIHDPDD